MSKRNKYNEELETKRTSPYDDMQDEDQKAEYEADMIDQDESDYAYDEEEYEEVERETDDYDPKFRMLCNKSKTELELDLMALYTAQKMRELEEKAGLYR